MVVVNLPQIIFYLELHLCAFSWKPHFYNYTLQTGKGWVMAFYLKSWYANIFRGLCVWGGCLLLREPQNYHSSNKAEQGIAWAESLTLNQDKINVSISTVKPKSPTASWPSTVYFKMKTKLYCKVRHQKKF